MVRSPRQVKPRLFISKCLGFAACRWNGITIEDDFVKSLAGHVEVITACPEVEIGLGVPRDPIRIVLVSGKPRLMQPATAKDVTVDMISFVENFLGTLKDIDGFILKDRSPSCGVDNVKIYRTVDPGAPIERAHGFFGGEIRKRFDSLPIETEGRLSNYRIREHFLTRIFTFADFRAAKKSKKHSELVNFHTNNKFLIMSYSQKELSYLGGLVANRQGLEPDRLFQEYEGHLRLAMARASRYTSNINILTHALGYFKDKLAAQEKKFFLELIADYRDNKVPLSVPVALVRSYIARFDEPYLKKQTFFSPYPAAFVSITDSGKGRT